MNSLKPCDIILAKIRRARYIREGRVVTWLHLDWRVRGALRDIGADIAKIDTVEWWVFGEDLKAARALVAINRSYKGSAPVIIGANVGMNEVASSQSMISGSGTVVDTIDFSHLLTSSYVSKK